MRAVARLKSLETVLALLIGETGASPQEAGEILASWGPPVVRYRGRWWTIALARSTSRRAIARDLTEARRLRSTRQDRPENQPGERLAGSHGLRRRGNLLPGPKRQSARGSGIPRADAVVPGLCGFGVFHHAYGLNVPPNGSPEGTLVVFKVAAGPSPVNRGSGTPCALAPTARGRGVEA